METNQATSDQVLYEAFLLARTVGGQPREEAVIEVADHFRVQEEDVMEAINRVRIDRSLSPIRW